MVVDEESINHAFKLLANLFLITRVVGSPHHIAVVGGEEWNSISSLVNAASALKDHEINRSFDKSRWSTQA